MSWPVPEFPLKDGENLHLLKMEFARLWAHTPQSRRIGYHLFPNNDDMQRALITQTWYTDALVLDEFDRICRDQPEDALPSKEQVMLEIVTAARNAPTVDDKVKAYKLYSDMAGYIEKPGTNVNINNDNRQVVFRVPAETSIEEFERGFREHQTKLYNDARQ